VDIDETIQVRCSRCKGKFRDKARRVRDGYSRQCPICERVMFFSDGSPNQDINDALRQAERARKLLRQAEDEKAVRPAASAEQAEDSEAAAVTGRTERRVRGSGRTTTSSR
jgi:NAD-dependent SIR2 family protein deacetylase